MGSILDNVPQKPGCHCVPIAGRCKVCKEIIADGWDTCQSCGWKVVESELIPV